MKRATGVVLGILLGVVLVAGVLRAVVGEDLTSLRLKVTRRADPAAFERQARTLFEQRHPGEKPLNWAIAETAERLHREQPMGRFVLHENDCSDFVGCVIDEALGPGARFKRGSSDHALCGEGGSTPDALFDHRSLPDATPVQPGDIVYVRHSPWYAPHDGSIGHVGVVGPNGRVLDFTKLKSWPAARYNEVEFEFFIQHNETDEVTIGRLRPEFRYRVLEIRR